ncbi:MAG: polyketide cyclase/dehydrase and lipid transport [Leptospira sp.]|nr:polyketide cyclase/dehydrase and lipid transport [Leptospira sp.]
MIITKAEVVIARPLEEVYKYLYSLENQTEYNTCIKSSIKVSDPKSHLPSFKIEINFGLFSLSEIYRIKELKENVFFIATCENNLLNFEDKYEFESVNEGTVLKITDQMELKGLLRLSEGIVKGNLSTQMQENILRVKNILEK